MLGNKVNHNKFKRTETTEIMLPNTKELTKTQ